ncbi:bifunctional folylpolyglutamate synthase/dihydrofolate synthase [Veillonella intestinalis]|uniref:bifunctional folylpolyglutamate synthase/dihydrofolate synthase n=1 Tax=Veillonella intestinalis TaxID=2941341 RepID=UPI00203F9583|nr:folylpolyglutamate synthase/dihydrofolate synthase family protein [Veillonella intestinalis]
MTYAEAVAYLDSCVPFGIKPGLERIKALLQAMDNPETAYKTIHITGTNGKGSVTALVDSVLTYSGRRVGRFTSPHLISYTERICVNGRSITEAAFGELIANVAKVVTKLVDEGLEPPTQFEVLTAAAFLFFREQGVDYAVIEVGLGGLLDSTNVVVPEVSVITNVTIDHQAYCGNTVEEIATHKAGIIKPKVPVVTAAQSSALEVIRTKAKELKSPIFVFNEDFSIKSRSAMPEGQMITLEDTAGHKDMLFTTLAGVHQAVNLACATAALRVLMKKDKSISEETLREGLARAKWAGRFEIVKRLDRIFIFDGAHNANGAEAFQLTYKELFKDTPKTMVLAVLADKEVQAVVDELVAPKDTVIAVPAPTPRSCTPEELASYISSAVTTASSVTAGLDQAMKTTKSGDIIVVAGSLYILGEAEQWLAAQ